MASWHDISAASGASFATLLLTTAALAQGPTIDLGAHEESRHQAPGTVAGAEPHGTPAGEVGHEPNGLRGWSSDRGIELRVSKVMVIPRREERRSGAVQDRELAVELTYANRYADRHLVVDIADLTVLAEDGQYLYAPEPASVPSRMWLEFQVA